jgi:hypothetical protein
MTVAMAAAAGRTVALTVAMAAAVVAAAIVDALPARDVVGVMDDVVQVIDRD